MNSLDGFVITVLATPVVHHDDDQHESWHDEHRREEDVEPVQTRRHAFGSQELNAKRKTLQILPNVKHRARPFDAHIQRQGKELQRFNDFLHVVRGLRAHDLRRLEATKGKYHDHGGGDEELCRRSTGTHRAYLTSLVVPSFVQICVETEVGDVGGCEACITRVSSGAGNASSSERETSIRECARGGHTVIICHGVRAQLVAARAIVLACSDEICIGAPPVELGLARRWVTSSHSLRGIQAVSVRLTLLSYR